MESTDPPIPLSVGVKKRLSTFNITGDTMHDLATEFSKTYKLLSRTSETQFLPTPIPSSAPSGKEQGWYLAIDIGGTNFRVAFVKLSGHSKCDTWGERIWPIKEALKLDNEESLFAWIGQCIAGVVDSFILHRKASSKAVPDEIPMGVTFSFPMNQKSLSEATLMPMGKGFAFSSKSDLGTLLLRGYQSAKTSSDKELPSLKIMAIANDAVATLVALSYRVRAEPSGRVVLAVILATGSNAAISSNRVKWNKSAPIPPNDHEDAPLDDYNHIINTEWGLSGAAGPLKQLGLVNPYDEILDGMNETPGFQPFEYMTSGRYLGELTRLAALDIFSEELEFETWELPMIMTCKNGLTSKFLGMKVTEEQDVRKLCSVLTEHLPPRSLPGLPTTFSWTPPIAQIFQLISRRVKQRSAILIAAAIVGLLDAFGEINLKPRINDLGEPKLENGDLHTCSDAQAEDIVVACAGGVISNFPGYRETCQTYIDKLMHQQDPGQPFRRIVLRDTVDGGIIGAGVLAGTASNLEQARRI
ncbi:MAG: hypothetical protein M1824_001589 [Vezdaea acicularis]|nr:MAG: hypothetical protein M1824_001589 [Vezdaea acicularis]